ncbi:hypothetical protein [Burkholderia ubonensis]|uniref:hypothetical protein n=1 Tax=Burkholderia ubonensis TaxID=101571 RepID=UPI0012FB646A|nr:hypothetical protein [Burkholderia ubonensis]
MSAGEPYEYDLKTSTCNKSARFVPAPPAQLAGDPSPVEHRVSTQLCEHAATHRAGRAMTRIPSAERRPCPVAPPVDRLLPRTFPEHIDTRRSIQSHYADIYVFNARETRIRPYP